jgi:hypothetical protein
MPMPNEIPAFAGDVIATVAPSAGAANMTAPIAYLPMFFICLFLAVMPGP